MLPGEPKHLLLIAFDFPPRRTSGIYRPTGLAKYLDRLGWRTTVLTVKPEPRELQDPLLLDRLPPNTVVVQTRYFNVMRWEDSAARAFRGAIASVRRAVRSRVSGPRASASSLPDGTSRKRSSTAHGTGQTLADWVRSWLYFPDRTTIGWAPFGIAKALQITRRQRFDVIYSTSPPRSSLVIGLFLKLLVRLPWVTEFRDPWYAPQRPVRAWAERRLLKLIARKADALVVMTQGHADDFARLGISPGKITVVPNGFDEQDFSSPKLTAGNGLLKPGYIHLTHLGTVYPECSGRFFEALKELVREEPRLKEEVRVNIIGYPDNVVQHYASDEDLRAVVSLRGFVGHSHFIEVMRSSQCLLLFWANPDFARLAVAGKTYEYLRSGRPILAVTHEGPMKALIENGNAGRVIRPDDKEGIKQALRSVIAAGTRLQDGDKTRSDFAAQFRYDQLAVRMAGVFEGVSEN